MPALRVYDHNMEQLSCPYCGDNCTHHGAVHVRSRTNEDAGGVETTVYASGKVSTHKLEASSHAFWGRRNDLAVEVWCEQCRRTSEFVIVQHKGATLMGLFPVADARSAPHDEEEAGPELHLVR